jgi:prolyl-tRNA editing enzyme YbaK/EbsC (Cys-tRNA(Pro) deacylase)
MASVSSVLDEAGVDYELLSHTPTERAADEANVLGLPPSAVAKTLVVAAPGGHVRVVLPASERIDLRKLRDYVEGGKRIRLGAVPPLGGASYDRVLVDARVMGKHSVVLEGARTSNRSGSRQATC